MVKVLALKKGEKILDVGCGTGDLACQMADAGAKVVGIDSSEKMIAKAKEKYPHSDSPFSAPSLSISNSLIVMV